VYNDSTTGIDLSGDSGNHKCVVYEVDTNNSNIYYFDSTNSVEGINVSYIVSLLFDTTIVTTFNNAITSQGLESMDGKNHTDNDDIYVFLIGYSSGSSRYQLGNLSIPFQSGANWFARNESAVSSSNGLNDIITSNTLASGMYEHNNGTKVLAVANGASWGVTNSVSDNTIIPLTGLGSISDMKLYFFIKIN
jgi:hypothetical protein